MSEVADGNGTPLCIFRATSSSYFSSFNSVVFVGCQLMAKNGGDSTGTDKAASQRGAVDCANDAVVGRTGADDTTPSFDDAAEEPVGLPTSMPLAAVSADSFDE